MTEKTTKILISWVEQTPDGNVGIQTRKYNNEEKADQFVGRLPERGITKCVKKITKQINLEVE